MITNWDEIFKRQPDRYTPYYDKKTGELVQVDDKDTGYSWMKKNDEWMAIG